MKQLIKSYKNILDNLYDGVYVVDKNRKIHYWNESAEEITGYSEEKMIDTHCYNNILEHVDEYGNNLCNNGCPLVKAINDKKPVEEEIYLHHNDGHRVPVKVKVTPLFDKQGEIIGAVEVFSNNSEHISLLRKFRELEAEFFIDDLTKVGNRQYIEKRIIDKLSDLKNYDWPFGVIKFSIKGFDKIRDTYGKSISDKVVTMVANTLKGDLDSHETLGRISEEEFIVIFDGVYEGDIEVIEHKLKRLIEVSYLKVEERNISIVVTTKHYIPEAEDDLEQIFDYLS